MSSTKDIFRSDEDRQRAAAVITVVMAERFAHFGRFTYGEVYRAADYRMGYDCCYRLTDRIIQRERKAGRIHQIERGVWAYVSG